MAEFSTTTTYTVSSPIPTCLKGDSESMNKILNWLRSLLPLGRDARIGSVVLTQGTASPTKKGTQSPSIRTSASRGPSHQDSRPNADAFSPLPTNSMILSLYEPDAPIDVKESCGIGLSSVGRRRPRERHSV